MRRPAAVADAALLLIAFQRIARAEPQKTPPHLLRWCRLLATAKTRSQPKQVFVAASATQSSSLSVLALILSCTCPALHSYTGIGSARIAGHPARAPVAQSWSSQSLESLAQSFGFDEPRDAVLLSAAESRLGCSAFCR